MFILNSYISIGNYRFDFVHQVTIESSWESMTDKASISLPAKLRIDQKKLKEQIKKGDTVVINIGYDTASYIAFKGVVARVKPSVPVVIECEDLMWHLKQLQVNDSANNETLQSFLSRNIPYEIDSIDITIPQLIASDVTAAQLLDQIKTDYGFAVFVRDNRILIGKQYDPQNYVVHKIHLSGENANVVQDNLEYLSKDDVKIQVTAISNLDSGEKLEFNLGDPDGEQRTLNFYNLSQPDLETIATKEYDRLLYDGYRGEIVVFGEPFIKHGDLVELTDQEENDKTGRYWVDGVTYQFGINGFRQNLKLGSRYVVS